MLGSAFHPNTFMPVRTWLRLARENRVAPRYRGRFLRALALSAAVAPLRLAEKALHGRRVRAVELSAPPIFVCGFARSGTTHLHNLFAADPGLGVLTTMQALMPTFFLVGSRLLRKRIERRFTSSTRGVDNVVVSLDSPSECELALANSTHLSAMHELSFPAHARRFQERYGVLGDGGALSPRELSAWKRVYLDILKKAALHAGNRRLVLKTPASTGRLPLLVDLFPDAKFVHIVRHPCDVFSSMMNMYRVMQGASRLEDCGVEETEAALLDYYAGTMQAYLRHREKIPAGNLAEVRYEDLERDPMGQMERLYARLDLGGWEEAGPAIRAYVDTLKNYRKNAFRGMDRPTLERIRDRWGFAFEQWGYELPAAEGGT